MSQKKYKSISEVSKLLNINQHVIRYWDSKFNGLSTRLSKNKQRIFNAENIQKIKNLRDTIYTKGKHNYSLDLANQIINKKIKSSVKIDNNISYRSSIDLNKIIQIRENLKKLMNL